jgi:iron complex transport system substrate-binding protein
MAGRIPKKACLFVTLLISFFCASPAFGAGVQDALGRVVSLESPPHRLIPLAPNLTEILYALGLGDRVVGVTNHCNYPPDVSLKPRVGSYISLNIERIISLSPDLVIGTVDGNERYVLDLLEQARIKVFFVNPRTVNQVMEAILMIGQVCGAGERAGELSGQLRQRVDRVLGLIGSRKRPLVFLQINVQPIMSINGNTVHHDVIRLAGGINMTADESINYPRISLEEVIRRKPDVIVISSMERGGRFEKARQEWFQWKSIPAVQDKRVHLVDSDLIDRPSPRLIVGLEIMAKLIHPEAEWK